MSDSASTYVGREFPNVTVFGASPAEKISTGDLVKGKKVVFVGVPGAFTPTCHNTHLPGFIENAWALKEAGVSDIYCVAVNDPFVMAAWGRALGAEGKVGMLADMHLELTKALDIELDASGALGNVRCKRFACVVDDGKITDFKLEPTGGGLADSTVENILAAVRGAGAQ